eukprot:6212808-Pleurochrysis_carterae.AAC.2
MPHQPSQTTTHKLATILPEAKVNAEAKTEGRTKEGDQERQQELNQVQHKISSPAPHLYAHLDRNISECPLTCCC